MARRRVLSTPGLERVLSLLARKDKLSFRERVAEFHEIFGLMERLRFLDGPVGRQVEVWSDREQRSHRVLCFTSNSYLGIQNHPTIRRHIEAALDKYGAGLAASAVGYGRTRLHQELEQRIAAFKQCEDALLFSSGFLANVGVATALGQASDAFLSDQLSHASWQAALKLTPARAAFFQHNDVADFKAALEGPLVKDRRDVFLWVEGVYSADGDVAPLQGLLDAASRDVITVVDEAHSTGVLGATGRGIGEATGLHDRIDVSMGTFSKTFAATGGFVAASRPIVEMMRMSASSHIFSTAMTPPQVGAILGAIEVVESEVWRVARLHANVDRLLRILARGGIAVEAPGGVVCVPVPSGIDVDVLRAEFFRRGVLLSVATFPVVPIGGERLRITVTAGHEDEDIDVLGNMVLTLFEELRSEA